VPWLCPGSRKILKAGAYRQDDSKATCRKVFRIGTVRYHWPMSAHASQAFSIASCTDSEDLPDVSKIEAKFRTVRIRGRMGDVCVSFQV